MDYYLPLCQPCVAYWANEGRPTGHYLVVSRGGHIPGAHDNSPEPPQCQICAHHWVKEGCPRDLYLIALRDGHLPGVVHVHEDDDVGGDPPAAGMTTSELVADQCDEDESGGWSQLAGFSGSGRETIARNKASWFAKRFKGCFESITRYRFGGV